MWWIFVGAHLGWCGWQWKSLRRTRQEKVEPSSPAWFANVSSRLPSKRSKLSLSRPKLCDEVRPAIVPMQDLANSKADVRSLSQFAKPISSECEMAAQGVIPSNIEANTQWAVCTFNAWAVNRSFLGASEAVADDLVASHDPQLVCKWLCRFLIEVRKSDGSSYPPSSLRCLVCGLNRVLEKIKHPSLLWTRRTTGFVICWKHSVHSVVNCIGRK